MTDLHHQYMYIKSSREVLFEFCRTLSADHFIYEHANFGRGSIRNLLVHIANVYQFWIGAKALGREEPFTPFDAVVNMDEMYSLFNKIDDLMDTFLRSIGPTPLKRLSFERNGVQASETALTLFTHVVTHEFHHKGQVLSMSRHMGYIPVDTDIIR